MKKKLLVLSMLILGSLSYGSSVTDNATVNLTVFKAVTLDVADIDFTKWMTGQTPGALTSAIKVTGGTAAKTMTLSTPLTLTLTESVSSSTIAAAIDITGNGTDGDTGNDAVLAVTLDGSGAYSGELKATIGAIPADQTVGLYTGTLTVSVTYN